MTFEPAARRPDSVRERTRVVIFGAETPAGKAFDVILIWLNANIIP